MAKKGNPITQATLDAFQSDAAYNLIIKENNAAQFEPAMTRAIAAALEEIGLVAEGYAKRLCPVDTGRLRASITHALNVGSKSVSIGTNVEYGPFIELGTRKRKAANGGRGFLRPAATDHVDDYRRIAKKHLDKNNL